MKRFLAVLLCLLFAGLPVRADDPNVTPEKVKHEDVHVMHISDEIGTATEVSVANDLSDAKKAGAKELRIIIHSPGGSVFSGLNIERQIRESGIPTVCEVDVLAASMAAYLFESSACGVRLVRPNAVLMFHEVRGGGDDQMHPSVKSHEQALYVLDRMLGSVIANRLGIPLETYMAMVEGHEVWVLGSRAVGKLRWADKVLPFHKPAKARKS